MRPPALVMRLAAVLSTTSAALRARQMSPFQARTPEPAAPWERSTAAVPEGVQRQRRWQRFSVGAVRPAPRTRKWLPVLYLVESAQPQLAKLEGSLDRVPRVAHRHGVLERPALSAGVTSCVAHRHGVLERPALSAGVTSCRAPLPPQLSKRKPGRPPGPTRLIARASADRDGTAAGCNPC